MPPLAEGDRADVREVTPAQHFTEPPPRYTEATLIKALEEHGIGRPSTYAATISTIVDRGYVVVRERRLHPELVAGIVTDLLVEHFGEFVDVAFTARMEERLDEVARGERAWVPLLRDFYEPLKALDSTRSASELKRRDFATEATDEVCSSSVTRWSSGSAATDGSWPARSSRSTRIPATAGRGGAAHGGRGRAVPRVRPGRPGPAPRPVRALPGLLALPRLRLHQAHRAAAARPAGVRGRLPEER